jgi:DNA-binding CsgD family transcriptional regulator
MPSPQELSRLLETLYATALQPELWPRFLEQLTTFLSLPAAAIVHQDCGNDRGSINVSVGLNPEGMKHYGQYYGRLDEYRVSIANSSCVGLVLAEEICPSYRLKKTEFYNDFLVKYGDVLLGAVIPSRVSTTFESLSLFGELDSDGPDKEAIDLVRLLIPHVKSAFLLHRHLFEVQAKANDLAAGLNRLQTAVILLGGDGSCIFLNDAAEQIISQKDGLHVRCSRLFASLSHELAQLQALVRQATTRKDLWGGTMLVSRRGRKPLQVSVNSFPAQNSQLPNRATAIVLIADPDRQRTPTPEMLRDLYGLTNAESRIAVALSEGKELRRVCEEASIAYNTGRAHLRSIFSKTGARRQAELVTLVSGRGLAFGDGLQERR